MSDDLRPTLPGFCETGQLRCVTAAGVTYVWDRERQRVTVRDSLGFEELIADAGVLADAGAPGDCATADYLVSEHWERNVVLHRRDGGAWHGLAMPSSRRARARRLAAVTGWPPQECPEFDDEPVREPPERRPRALRDVGPRLRAQVVDELIVEFRAARESGCDVELRIGEFHV